MSEVKLVINSGYSITNFLISIFSMSKKLFISFKFFSTLEIVDSTIFGTQHIISFTSSSDKSRIFLRCSWNGLILSILEILRIKPRLINYFKKFAYCLLMIVLIWNLLNPNESKRLHLALASFTRSLE